MIRLLFILFFLFEATQVLGQEPTFKQYTDDEGLPSLLIYDFEQDAEGYLWVATEAGLFRYNGLQFEPFVSATSKASAVGNLIKDENGTIWCQNFSDQIFYVQNNKLQEFTAHQKANVNRFISYGLNNKGIWIPASNGKEVILFAKDHSYTKNYNIPIESGYISTVLSTQSGEILVSTEKQLLVYNEETDKFLLSEKYKFTNNLGEIIGVNQIFSHNNSLLGYANGAKEIHLIKNGITHSFNYDLKLNGPILCIHEIDENTCWLGGTNGIYVIKTTGNYELNTKPLFAGSYVTSIYKDNENSYWIGTLRNGMYLIPNRNIENHSLYGNKSQNSAITLLLKLSNELLLCTNSGESFTGNSLKGFSLIPPVFAYEVEAGLFMNKSKIILGNSLYSKPNYEFISSISSFTVKGIGYYNNLLYIASNTGSFSRPVFSNITIKSTPIIRPFRTRAMFLDTLLNNWYVAYTDGLFIHKIDNPTVFEEIKYNEEPIFAKCITKNTNGDILVGTMFQGVFIIKPNQTIINLTTANGLLNNGINDILEYNNNFWIATSLGLQEFNPLTYENKIYNRSDGLSSNEVSKIQILNNRIYAATARSLNSLPINLSSRNEVSPPIYITQLMLGPTQLNIDSTLEIPYNSDVLTIKFNALTYKSSGKFYYKYRTLGLDTTWHLQNGLNNSVSLYALQPGNYTFQIIAINEDGVKSKLPAELSFKIKTPFTKSKGFYFLIIIIIIGITSLIFITRIGLIRKKNEAEKLKNTVALEKSKIEQDLRESQLASLKAQLNPHFIFNALNSIQEFILLNEPIQANKFLGMFADLMRITLEMSNQKSVLLEEELKCLKLYLALEGLRFEDTFEYEIYLEENINTHQIEIPSMIIQPYVENAIKHGLLHKKENRQLKLRFNLKNNNKILSVEIEDNGIGRDAAEKIRIMRKKQHKSFATNANKKRLELLNNEQIDNISVEIIDLKDSENLPVGTLVKLNIPINN